MKKLFLPCIILFLLLFYSIRTNIPIPTPHFPSKSITPSPTPQPQGITPTRLVIEKLAIDASVESVGLDKTGNMDVPKNNQDVAWYNLGFKPGEKGSAVIAGHFDTVTGAPAVFYTLEKLVPNDQIIIYDKTGKKLLYKVTATQTYPYDKFPLQKVFNTKGTSQLNLITCDGVFDPQKKNYSKRLVVFSELEKTNEDSSQQEKGGNTINQK